ncbi:hypothetical protein [Arthrobacter sp. HY1533]|uniref:hypothetical protein n=1 Tax=Arthrobacter sp. HY1533 TaxID=2970919 RepID=UPI0022B9E89F|nr:hypothetical protein [Arthrobacter sp. HY1533]
MQSDPGPGTPQTGGNDEEIWRDLVARLEEPDDAFIDDDDAPSGESAPSPGPAGPARDAEPKGVVDFDPLGVWQQEAEPAPRERSAGERAGGTRADGERTDGTARDDAAAWGPRDYAAADDEDEEGGFVPEDLPSLRNSEPAIVLSWIGAAGAPLFLVFASIFWRSVPMTLVLCAVAAFVAGVGYLIYRLPAHRDHDDGDGAVV